MTTGGNMQRQTGLRGSLARTRRQRQASPLAVALAGLASMAASGSAEALLINTSYDSSINSAPAGFSSAFQTAVNFFQSTFRDSITVNIKVGWGEIGGKAIASGALGQSQTYLAGYYSYDTVRNAMISDARSSADWTAVARRRAVALIRRFPADAGWRSAAAHPARRPPGRIDADGSH